MSVAFLLMAHDHPAQLGRLVERLAGPGAAIYLHIDRKSDRQRMLAQLPHGAVTVLDPRESVPVYWGGFSVLHALLNTLRAARRHDHTHYCCVSGLDYPVVGRERLLQALQEPGERIRIDRELRLDRQMPYRNFIRSYWVMDNPVFNPRAGSRLLHKAAQLLLGPVKRPVPADLRFYHGSAWWNLSRAAVDEALGLLEARPDLHRWMRHVFAPDEMLFGTALKRGGLAPTITQDWTASSPPQVHPNLSGVHYIDWSRPNPGSPRTLLLEDLPDIQASGALLARKTHPERSRALLDALDRLA